MTRKELEDSVRSSVSLSIGVMVPKEKIGFVINNFYSLLKIIYLF